MFSVNIGPHYFSSEHMVKSCNLYIAENDAAQKALAYLEPEWWQTVTSSFHTPDASAQSSIEHDVQASRTSAIPDQMIAEHIAIALTAVPVPGHVKTIRESQHHCCTSNADSIPQQVVVDTQTAVMGPVVHRTKPILSAPPQRQAHPAAAQMQSNYQSSHIKTNVIEQSTEYDHSASNSIRPTPERVACSPNRATITASTWTKTQVTTTPSLKPNGAYSRSTNILPRTTARDTEMDCMEW